MMKKTTGKLRVLPEVTAFASVLLVIMVIYLFLFLDIQHSWPGDGVGTDPPKTNHAAPLPNANKFDAIVINIRKDGTMYLGSDRVTPQSIPGRIKEAIAAGAEKKVYVRADARTKTGYVNEVVDAIRTSGIEDIAFLAEERRPTTQPQTPSQ